MDCLRSFSLSSPANETLVAPDFDYWQLGVQHYWSVEKNGFSYFDIQGFKNINIYGIDVVGDFMGAKSLASNAIVNDWSVGIELVGQPALVGGVLQSVPNFLSIQNEAPYVNFFTLSKFKRKFELATPIQSVTQIKFQDWKAFGIANESITQIQLLWNLNFIFYYKFEGE